MYKSYKDQHFSLNVFFFFFYLSNNWNDFSTSEGRCISKALPRLSRDLATSPTLSHLVTQRTAESAAIPKLWSRPAGGGDGTDEQPVRGVESWTVPAAAVLAGFKSAWCFRSSRGTKEWRETMSEAAVNIPVRLVYVQPVVAPLDFVSAVKLHLNVCVCVSFSLFRLLYTNLHTRVSQVCATSKRFKVCVCVFFFYILRQRLHAGRTKRVSNLSFASLALWSAPFWQVSSDFRTRVCDSADLYHVTALIPVNNEQKSQSPQSKQKKKKRKEKWHGGKCHTLLVSLFAFQNGLARLSCDRRHKLTKSLLTVNGSASSSSLLLNAPRESDWVKFFHDWGERNVPPWNQDYFYRKRFPLHMQASSPPLWISSVSDSLRKTLSSQRAALLSTHTQKTWHRQGRLFCHKPSPKCGNQSCRGAFKVFSKVGDI